MQMLEITNMLLVFSFTSIDVLCRFFSLSFEFFAVVNFFFFLHVLYWSACVWVCAFWVKKNRKGAVQLCEFVYWFKPYHWVSIFWLYFFVAPSIHSFIQSLCIHNNRGSFCIWSFFFLHLNAQKSKRRQKM